MTKSDFDTHSFPPGNDGRVDLVGEIQLGAAILIDFNHVLMCLHTLVGFPNSAMAKHQIKVVFNNDVIASKADSSSPPFPSETPRPFCFLRGDIGAFVGSGESQEDFAIVQIDWHQTNGVDDFHLIGKSAVLAPPTFDRKSLQGKRVAAIQQFSDAKQVLNAQSKKQMFSGHISQGLVTGIDKEVSTRSGSTAANRATTNQTSIFGASGSGVYNEDGELVGVLNGGGGGVGVFFFPLDLIYASTNVAFGVAAGDKLRAIFNFRKGRGEFRGEGKGKPVP